jgi:hypothetical protein
MKKIDCKWFVVIVVTSLFIGWIASVVGAKQPENDSQSLIHISIDHTNHMVYSEEK